MAFINPTVWLMVQNELMESSSDDGGGGDSSSSPEVSFDDFDDEALFQTFHLNRACITFISDNIGRRMQRAIQATKPAGVSVDGMIMITLNYYAHGVLSLAIQEKTGMKQVDCADVIRIVSKVISGMADHFISFPFSSDDRADVASEMERFCGIPRVLGVLECAQFKVKTRVSDTAALQVFLNNWGHSTVAIQMICDCDGNLLSVEENCRAGSTPPQDIWDSSLRKMELEGDVHGDYRVIAGKDYTLSKQVLPPVIQPSNEKDKSFNVAHAKLHSVMQKTLYSMKRRFGCLLKLGFAKESALDKKVLIIKACCVLHNIAKKFSVPAPPSDRRN